MDKSNEPAMQELIKAVGQSGYSLHDLLNSMGYCGFKLWLQEDVETQFAAMMREKDSVSDGLRQLWEGKTAAEVGIKIQDCDKELSSCTDEEWGTIWHCVSSKARLGMDRLAYLEAEASIGNMQGR